MTKRILAVLAALALVLALAACNNTPAPASSTTGESSDVTEEPTTIRWFWREGGDPAVPEDCYITQKILELINVKYIHITPIGQSQDEKLTTMLSTGDIPDIAESYGEFTTKLRDFGAIIPVDDLVASDALKNVRTNQLMFDDAMKSLKRSDGKTWAIPATFAELSGPVPHIRYDWLENLGLEVPTTFEDLADVLDKFTNNDPDGNGVKDTWGTSYGGVYDGFALNWGAEATQWYWTEDGKSIEWGLFTDHMVPYEKYMRGLMETEGLNNEIVDPDELGSKHSNFIKSGQVGFSWGYTTVNDNIEILKVQEGANWAPVTPMKGIYDKGYLSIGSSMRQEYCIFRDCEREGRLDAALKLMDLLADDGGDPTSPGWDSPYWVVNYGEKGVNWDVIDGVFQNATNNETIKINNEGKDYIGRCRRWRTVSMQLGLNSGNSPELTAANATIMTYPMRTDMPNDPGYPLTGAPAETVSGLSELSTSFNTLWSTYWTQAWLGQVDIEAGLEDCRQQALDMGYEDVRDRTIELYKQCGFMS